MPALEEQARAKVNLTLRVLARRVDGYHDLESVVVFADCADRLTLDVSSDLDLVVTGPRAEECGPFENNLVIKAARLLAERVNDLRLGRFSLEKHLPVAAGIGGGSADAAATLRLLARANDLTRDDARLREVAQLTGADVLVCLPSTSCVMTGIGETLMPLSIPRLPCVMVNPQLPVPTKNVFSELGLRPGQLNVGMSDIIEAIVWPTADGNVEQWLRMLAGGINDLEAPALRVQPAIGTVLEALRATDRVRIARMSGSGATCFAIYDDASAAEHAAAALKAEQPTWWVHAGWLG